MKQQKGHAWAHRKPICIKLGAAQGNPAMPKRHRFLHPKEPPRKRRQRDKAEEDGEVNGADIKLTLAEAGRQLGAWKDQVERKNSCLLRALA